MDLVPYAVHFFLLAIVSEFAWGLRRGKNTYRLNDTVNSLSLGVLSTATKLLGLNLAGTVFGYLSRDVAPAMLDPEALLTWILALLLYDFCYYWFHRISHERTLFWASHVAHHQSEAFNLSTALRQTSTGFLVSWVFYVPCFLVGVPADVFVTIASAHLIYQFWIHSEHIPKLGWLEWFLVTASNHRVHHARNPAYVDKNYGGLLIVWDRLFGTFCEERNDEPCVYGITTPLRSWNPLWANVHVYTGMLREAIAGRSLVAVLRVLISRTGQHAINKTARTFDRGSLTVFDPAVGRGTCWYVGIQFVFAVLFSLGFERIAPELDMALRWVVFGYLLLWLVALGLLLEGAPKANGLELLRFALTLAGAAVVQDLILLLWIPLVGYCLSLGGLLCLRRSMDEAAQGSVPRPEGS